MDDRDMPNARTPDHGSREWRPYMRHEGYKRPGIVIRQPLPQAGPQVVNSSKMGECLQLLPEGIDGEKVAVQERVLWQELIRARYGKGASNVGLRSHDARKAPREFAKRAARSPIGKHDRAAAVVPT